MSRLSDLLESNNNRGNDRLDPDELADQIGGYFEDVMFNLESISELPVVPPKLKTRLRKIYKDVLNIKGDLDKEL